MLSRALVIAKKELLQLRRDRMTLAMMIVLPLLQLLLFGYAINTDVRHVPLLMFDQDRSAPSRDLARSLEATGFYDLVGYTDSYAEIARALAAGRARAALVVPPRYASDLVSGRPTTLQLVVDGSDPQIVASATNTAASLIGARSLELLLARGSGRGAALGEPIRLEPTIWYNPELRTAVYVVPGLVGVILTMTMVMLTSMAIARERERGTLEQLIVSPVRRLELMVGKIVPYVSLGYVQMTIILLAGRLVFGVPILGSLVTLYALALIFIAANLALGLFFSTVAQTQQQAMQMSFFFLLPNMLLSGFMFPFEAMPRPAQWIGQALPLTHFLRIVRGILLKGNNLAEILPNLWPIAAFLLVVSAIALARYRETLD